MSLNVKGPETAPSLEEKKALLAKLIRRRSARSKIAPVSLGQERLWFVAQLARGSAVYHVPVGMRLRGEFGYRALHQALAAMVERHEILRTAVPTMNGLPVQEIFAEVDPRLPVVDLSGLPEALRPALEQRLGDELFSRRIDLGRPLLWRAALVRSRADCQGFFFTVHHIAFDDGSARIFGRQLTALQRAYGRGEPAPLGPPRLQYGDFARWQRRRLESGDLQPSLEYWRRQLAGLPTLELATDRPRPKIQTFDGKRVAVRLDGTTLDRLRAEGGRLGVTLFMSLLAGFQTLLYRFSGQTDVPVGTPVTGRTREETEELIGYFVNMVVMRGDLAGEPSFGELASRTRRRVSEALSHQQVPFEWLVDELQPARDLSRNPLFQVAFVMLNISSDDYEFEGTRASGLEVDYRFSKFDLTLTLRVDRQGLLGFLEFNARLFDTTTGERMAAAFVRLVEAAALEPGKRLGELPSLGPAERQRLREWCGRPAAPGPLPVYQIFEARADQDPAALALCWPGGTLDYAALDTRAARLASHLASLGSGPETVVGLLVEGLAERVVGALGILKAGAAYLPLDPEHPPARLAAVTSEAGARLVVTEARWLERLGTGGARAICLDRDQPAIDAETPARRRPALPEQLAYVVFTSGSSGRPKGVAVGHGALAALVSWHLRAFAPGAGDRATQVAGAAFDASIWEIWPALATGASLHRPAPEERAHPEALRDFLVREGITESFLPTPLAELVLGLEWPAETRLRWLLTGGDTLRVWPRRGLPFTLSNNYGPSENAVVATSTAVYPRQPGTAGLPSIGWPIDGVEVRLLDRHARPVPLGVGGELYLGGASLARGYLGRPGRTAEVFVPDPIGERAGARLYRTGDLARHLPTAELEFRGRADQQVKVRGHRIEPGEVEAVLGRHPGVCQAAVQATAGASSERRLVAYYAKALQPGPSAEELRAYLLELLPAYLVPDLWVELESLPTNANGKLDRRRLPVPDGRRPELEVAYVEPESELEVCIAAVWRESLGVDRVGIHDNFFDLGGNSLKMIQVHRRLEQALGQEVAILTLFSCPNVKDLAEHLSGQPSAVDTLEAEASSELQQGKQRLLRRMPRWTGTQQEEQP
jgi:amino acid adenylation domain-containing protein